MTIPNVSAGGLITEAWGDAVADAINRLGFNVKAYGATGNGTTNDTAAIQAAIDAANAANVQADPATDESIRGAVVYFPPGLYSVTTLNWKSNVSARGAGHTHGRSA